MNSTQTDVVAEVGEVVEGGTGTTRANRRPPNCVRLWPHAVVTGSDTINLNPWAADLDPSSTARVAVMARERALWIQFDACFGLAHAGDWDVQETLARGLSARPNGTLLEIVAAAYPDGLGHGFEVEEFYEQVVTGGHTRFPWESDAAQRVLEDHLRGLDGLDLSDSDMAFAAVWAGLDSLCRWRLGKLTSAQPDQAIAHAHALVEAIKEADRDLTIADDHPIDLSSQEVTALA